MSHPVVRSIAWMLALLLGLSLSACGGDEHKDHKNHDASGSSK
jgi:hypothetical protein